MLEDFKTKEEEIAQEMQLKWQSEISDFEQQSQLGYAAIEDALRIELDRAHKIGMHYCWRAMGAEHALLAARRLREAEEAARLAAAARLREALEFENERAKSAAEAAMCHWLNQILGLSYRTWQWAVTENSVRMKSMRTSLQLLKFREIAMAWEQWQQTRVDAKNQNFAMGRAICRMLYRKLSVAWKKWYQPVATLGVLRKSFDEGGLLGINDDDFNSCYSDAAKDLGDQQDGSCVEHAT